MKTENKKAIELFEKWYNTEYIKKHKGRSKLIDGTYFDFFLQLPFEMQWGVWLKFFDDQESFIVTDHSEFGAEWWFSIYDLGIHNPEYDFLETREQAQKAAIEKALTILNDRL